MRYFLRRTPLPIFRHLISGVQNRELNGNNLILVVLSAKLLSMPTTNRIFVFVAVAAYSILFILISLYVFIENDESQPIKDIFHWNYLIPVTIYSVFSLWVSFGLFLLLNKIFSNLLPNTIFSKIISFPLSLIIGIPVGVFGLDKVLRLLTT